MKLYSKAFRFTEDDINNLLKIKEEQCFINDIDVIRYCLNKIVGTHGRRDIDIASIPTVPHNWDILTDEEKREKEERLEKLQEHQAETLKEAKDKMKEFLEKNPSPHITGDGMLNVQLDADGNRIYD